jgi:hypothetical protein
MGRLLLLIIKITVGIATRFFARAAGRLAAKSVVRVGVSSAGTSETPAIIFQFHGTAMRHDIN